MSTVSLSLNAAGLSTGISDGTYATSITRNANDLPTTIGLPGSVNQHGQYDGASRTTYVDAVGPTGVSSPLNNTYTYGYDQAGWTNSLASTVNGTTTNTLTITHDALGHLTGATGTGVTGSWAYANQGDNLTSSTSNGGPTTTYTYSASNANQLASTTTSGASTYYSYDQSGHATRIGPTAQSGCDATGTTCLFYDAQGRLGSVVKASGLSVSMTYNAAGQRMTYAASGGGANLSESFQYRGGELAQVTTSGSQNTTDTYLYRRDGTPLELIRTAGAVTNRYWYEVDGRGDVIALTDVSGNTVDRYTYDLWGALVSSSETVPQRLRFAGGWYDQELGWYWMTTRAYDPVLERFLQPDPSQQEGIFTYAYAGDDPVDYQDNTGMMACRANMVDGVCPTSFSTVPVREVASTTAAAITTAIASIDAPAPVAPVAPVMTAAPPAVQPLAVREFAPSQPAVFHPASTTTSAAQTEGECPIDDSVSGGVSASAACDGPIGAPLPPNGGGGGEGGGGDDAGDETSTGTSVDGVILDATVNPGALADFNEVSADGTQVTTLYRVVSVKEAQDIQANGGFRAEPRGLSYEGKLFATSAANAARFGRMLYSQGGESFFTVRVDVPSALESSYVHFAADGMPAVSVDASELARMNSESLITIVGFTAP